MDYDQSIQDIFERFERERRMGYALDRKDAVQRIKALMLEYDNSQLEALRTQLAAKDKEIEALRAENERLRIIEADFNNCKDPYAWKIVGELRTQLAKAREAAKTLANLFYRVHVTQHVTPLNPPECCTLCRDANAAQEALTNPTGEVRS